MKDNKQDKKVKSLFNIFGFSGGKAKDGYFYRWAYELLPSDNRFSLLNDNCADGVVIHNLLSRYDSLKAIGIAKDETDVAKTVRMNRLWMRNGRCEVIVQSRGKYPYHDGSFDLVICFKKEPSEDEIREYYRLMSPNGILLLADTIRDGRCLRLRNLCTSIGFVKPALAEEEEEGFFALRLEKEG